MYESSIFDKARRPGKEEYKGKCQEAEIGRSEQKKRQIGLERRKTHSYEELEVTRKWRKNRRGNKVESSPFTNPRFPQRQPRDVGRRSKYQCRLDRGHDGWGGR